MKMALGHVFAGFCCVIWCIWIVQARPTLWKPIDGDLNSYMRCHGLPCEEWEKIQMIKDQINAMDTALSETPQVTDSNRLFDLVNPLQDEEVNDIWLTYEQAKEMLTTIVKKDHLQKRRKRKAENFSTRPFRKWQLPIMYKFDGSHTDREKEVIRGAFRHWQEQTCIRFFEVNVDAPISTSHLLLTADGSVCASFVGRLRLKKHFPQQINLASRCLQRFGVAVHEIGHALGMWHEHQREDRDRYIKVVSENLGSWARTNFKPRPKGSTDDYGVPYDYNSVMHYGGTVATLNGKETILTKDERYQYNIGQRTGLSFMDAKLINLAYCTRKCRTQLPYPCLHGGYQNPNKCNTCKCPDGFTGTLCERVSPPKNADCGGTIVLEPGIKINVSTPGYLEGKSYENGQECTWRFKAPAGMRVTLRFEELFAVYCYSRACHHWAEVRMRADFSLPGPRFCCYRRPEFTLTSDTEQMMLLFRTNMTSPYKDTRSGFMATVVATDPNGRYNETEDYPLEDLEYRDNVDLENVTAPEWHWSDWSNCYGHDCQCGGCSYKKRHRICGSYRCTGELEKEDVQPCSKQCRKTDKQLFYISGLIQSRPCPLCCRGFVPSAGTCKKAKN